MTRNLKVYLRRILGLIFSLFIVACTVDQSEVELRKANWSMKQKEYRTAIYYYNRVIKRSPKADSAIEAARMGYRVALFSLEDFQAAVSFLSHIVMHSPSEEERKDAQRNLATIYFEKINDYKKSVIEFNRLLTLKLSDSEAIDYRFDLARSHFYLKEFYQSEVEIDQILKKDLPEKKRFQTLLFLANIYLTNKQTDKAINHLVELKTKYPALAHKENIDLSLSVAYEEMSDFQKAIEILQDMRNSYSKPEFIDLKIRRLKERQRNLPGARGYRK